MELKLILKFTLRHLQVILVLILIILSALLITIPLLFLLSIWRILVWLASRLFRPDLEDVLSSTDSAFALNKKSGFVNLMGVFIIDGEMSVERLRHLFQTRILDLKNEKGLHPYRKKLTQFWTSFGGCAFWKTDTKFDLRNHIRPYDAHLKRPDLAIPSPYSEEDLGRIGGKIVQLPWKQEQSRWELLVLTPNEAGNGGAVFLRVDHIIGDGYSLMELCKTLFDTLMRVPELKLHSGESRSFSEGLYRALKAPYDCAEFYLDGLKTKKYMSPPAPGGSRTESETQSCVSRDIPVETIKAIKNHHGVLFASVLHSVIQGAIARCLREAGLTVPRTLMTSVVLPLPNHPGGLCNHALEIEVDLPCKATSAHDRLQRVDKVLKSLKHTAAPYVRTKVVSLLCSFMPVPLRSFAYSQACDMTDYTVSNFPVIQNLTHCDGMAITNFLVFLSEVNSELGMTVFGGGLNNKQKFSFVYNKGQFGLDAYTAPDLIALKIQEELQALLDTTV